MIFSVPSCPNRYLKSGFNSCFIKSNALSEIYISGSSPISGHSILLSTILENILSTVSSLKGGIPTKNSYSITPNDQKSKVLFDVDIPFIISGAI